MCEIVFRSYISRLKTSLIFTATSMVVFIRSFIKENEDIREDLQVSMDRSLLQSKKTQIKNRPSQLVTKSISSLMDIDTRIVDRMSEDEKRKIIIWNVLSQPVCPHGELSIWFGFSSVIIDSMTSAERRSSCENFRNLIACAREGVAS